MVVFMVGGTGLIGSEVAKLLIAQGHEVTSLALPNIPKGASLPVEMKLEFGNYLDLSNDELLALMAGAEGFVFAAGIDERVEGAPPIYDLFKKYNIDPLKRLLGLAQISGIKNVVICGSYFSHFAKKWPKLQLTTHHPYIRSRIDQEQMALQFASKDFNVAIIELPYLFGIQPGRKPVWVFLVEMIQRMKRNTYFPKGGTTMVTVKQTAQAIVGALEKNQGGNTYPLGYYNMEWKEFLTIVHEAMGCKTKKIKTIPNFVFKIAVNKIGRQKKKQGIETGLKMRKFSDIQTSKLFIQPSEAADFLGVEEDDIIAAIKDSVKLSMAIIEEKEKEIVDMLAK